MKGPDIGGSGRESFMQRLQDVQVVILCGGMGTRLKEETEYRPKPMVPIGGKPILWHIMKIYGAHEITRFVLCLGFKGEVIKEYFLNYEIMTNDFTIRLGSEKETRIRDIGEGENWTVTLADTGLETMTGGRIKRIENYIEGDHFMMTYGDGVGDINLRRLFAYHLETGRIATVTGVHPQSRFGVIETNEQKRDVLRFREKPELDEYVSGGFFVFSRRIFDILDQDCVLEAQPLMKLAEEGQLSLYPHKGFWKSMDTYRDYLDFNDMWKQGDTPWKIW
jgi:glucose-1-phosphate cytidylyltransferase